MNLDREPVRVGRPSGSRNVAIDESRVARYAQAMGVPGQRYDTTAPGLLLHSECYEDLSWYLHNIWGNLHARQEWELFGPMPVGEEVTTRGFVRERYRKRGRDYVVKETWVLDGSGQLLNRGITHQSFLVETQTDGDAVAKKPRPARRPDPTTPPAIRTLAPLDLLVDDETCMAFSGPERTYHTDRDEARALGFPDIVVQGMLPICLLGELLAREFGSGWNAGGKMDVRLVNVLWAGEEVSARAEVTAETPESDGTRVHLTCWVEKKDGTKVIVGNASAVRTPDTKVSA
ncbi:MAG: acyl dehydratase [Hyphomicrobiaceae bacterium]|jgi:acyl dehydratase